MIDKWDKIARQSSCHLMICKAEVPTAKNHSQVCNEITKRVAAALREAVEDERERCAKIAEAESGPGFSCRHVDHSQGFCECSAKAAAIRARSW